MVSKSKSYLLYILLGASCTQAFEFPFRIPGFSGTSSAASPQEVLESPNEPLRVAIIGAGASGSSAAFWISEAKKRHGVEVDVDIFEKSGRIGGRSLTVYPFGNESLPPIELGASIFVDSNRNLMRASKEFNLTLFNMLEDGSDMGIWDGTQFVLSVGGGGWTKWIDNLKLLWRYGYKSCTRVPKMIDAFMTRYLDVYTPSISSWKSVEDLSTQFGFTEQTSQTAEAYFTSKGVGELFVHELIEGATRVNYGQNTDDIQGLLGSVSMAANKAHAVKGGNYKIFEGFVARAGAKLHLNTAVTGLLKTETSGKTKWFITTSPSSSTPIAGYDHVIIAAPIHNSQITIVSSPASFDPVVEYVHLHVTLFSTTSPTFDPVYFGLSEGANVPSMVLTTWDAVRSGRGEGPDFNSIAYHGLVKNDTEGKVWTGKVFSKERKSDEWLSEILGDGQVGWVYRTEFDAYPKIGPVTSYPSLHPDTGLWYSNSFESFMSAMEVMTLSARNIVDGIFKEQYDSGLCGVSGHKEEEEEREGVWGGSGAEGKIWGWDC